MGGGVIQHGGGHRLHLLLVQRQGGPDALPDGGVLHGGAGREHHPHWTVVSHAEELQVSAFALRDPAVATE